MIQKKVTKSQKKNEIVVYTAIFGGKDTLVEPPKGIKGCDFICFTDDKTLKSEVYDVKVIKTREKDPIRAAKVYKILPHKYFNDYKYSLWIDGNFEIKSIELENFVKENLKNSDIVFFEHESRDCIYVELLASIERNKESPERMREQVEKYKKEGYPEKNGLVAGGIILRKNNSKAVQELDEAWWQEIVAHSTRDQLSLLYVAWKKKVKIGLIKENIRDNNWFKIQRHKRPYSFSADPQKIIELLEKRDKEILDKKAQVEKKDRIIEDLFKKLELKDEWIKHLEKDITFLNAEILRIEKKKAGKGIFKKRSSLNIFKGGKKKQ